MSDTTKRSSFMAISSNHDRNSIGRGRFVFAFRREFYIFQALNSEVRGRKSQTSGLLFLILEIVSQTGHTRSRDLCSRSVNCEYEQIGSQATLSSQNQITVATLTSVQLLSFLNRPSLTQLA